MAICFNLGLVARTQADADACVAFFRARPLVLDGVTIEFETFVHARDVDVLVGAWPKGMSQERAILLKSRLNAHGCR